MAIRNDAVETQKLKTLINNPDKPPEARLLAARRLLRDYGFSERNVITAKRIAKRFMKDRELSPEVRIKATNLLKFVSDERKTDEDVDDCVNLDGPQPVLVTNFKNQTRPEYLADKNKNWNAEPVPQKWLTYFESADLIPFGIPDLVGSPERFSVDKPFSPFLPGFVLNPKYVEAYRAWRSKRFPYGLPDRETSSWRLRFEEWCDVEKFPSIRAKVSPEMPTGLVLRQLERARGDVFPWEESWARDLYFELVFGDRKSDELQIFV